MTAKNLAIVFIICAVVGFFLTTAGYDAGNIEVTTVGVIVLVIGGISFGKWWSNPDRK